MQSREAWQEDDLDERDVDGDILILDPNQPPEHIPGPDFAKQLGRGGDEIVDSDGEPDELIIDPKLDLIRKRDGLGGAIPMAKQVGRPVEIDLDDDEDIAVTFGDAIPNDPSRPRVKGPDFDKQGERFRYEPEASEQAGADEIAMPAAVKPIDREKVLFKMDK